LVDPFEVVAQQEQVPAVGTAEDAGEARQVGLDAVGDLTTVEHSDAGTGGIAGVTGVCCYPTSTTGNSAAARRNREELIGPERQRRRRLRCQISDHPQTRRCSARSETVGSDDPGDSARGWETGMDRSCRALALVVASCLVAGLVGCTTSVTGANAAGANAAGASSLRPTPAGGASIAPVRVLQLNLCDSGIAACYSGRSVAEAAAVIRAETPDLVTLNEVCQDDVSSLQSALAEVVPGGAAVSAFQAARDRRSGKAYRCRNGLPYGIGVVSRWPSVPGSSPDAGIYPTQDREDPEERAWLCMEVAATPAVAVCTTHLAYTKRTVATAQCRYLFGTVIARMRARDGAAPLVLGGDLNLGSGDNPDLTACLPAGSALVDDGGEQHVVATSELVVESSRTIDLHGTTDHPGLLVRLVARVGHPTP
jgi:endonuclease/exonuclease/phosphatase family metal-dependent hydrolase